MSSFYCRACGQISETYEQELAECLHCPSTDIITVEERINELTDALLHFVPASYDDAVKMYICPLASYTAENWGKAPIVEKAAYLSTWIAILQYSL